MDKIELTTDKRCQEGFSNKVTWSDLDAMYSRLIEKTALEVNVIKQAMLEKKEKIVNRVNVKTMKGLLSSYQDVVTKLKTIRGKHSGKKGAVDQEDYNSYMAFLGLIEEYTLVEEELAQLTGAGYLIIVKAEGDK